MMHCARCGSDRTTIPANVDCPRCGTPGHFVSHGPPLPATLPPTHGGAPYWPPPPTPVQPRPFKIAFGVAFCLLSLWLMFSWLPSKKPLSDAEAVVYVTREVARGNVGAIDEWRLNPKIYPWAYLIAAAIGVWGVSGIVRGATYRPSPRR